VDTYEIGERVVHQNFGLGTVITKEVNEIIQVDFEQRGRKRLSLKFAPLRRAAETDADELRPGGRAYQKWVNETFNVEGEDARHYLGSHWSPFFNDAKAAFERLPEIISQALIQVTYSDNHPPLRSCPTSWPKAVYHAWPLRVHGITAVSRIDMDERVLKLVSLYPFDAEGRQHQLVLEKVHVWGSGVEAQIECAFGTTSITFFDTLYAANRDWYEIGKTYQFILTGIAYECRKAADQVYQALNPPLPEEFKKENPEIAADWPKGDTIPVHSKGMAAFFPIDQWDRDDYSFTGPIKSVKEITFLEQPGWKVRVTVLREFDHGDRDLDLEILVTQKVWGEGTPPKVGEDMEGAIWLQGYLWWVGAMA